jgi:alpha-1,3-rhamnosyl/mannosyltransferase
VNLLWCVPGRVGGSEQYLVRQLRGLPDDWTPTLYCLPAFRDAHPDLAERFDTVVAPIDGRVRGVRVAIEHSWLARRTRREPVVHHGGGTAPSLGGTPIVLTVHDLQYETFPQYTNRLKLAYLRWAMPRSARRATVIAVPTEYVRGTVIDRFGADDDRVVVVPHGVEPDLGARARSEAAIRESFGLGDGPVVVLPAITHPHKGHEFLLDLMSGPWADPDLRVVFIGGAGAADDAIRQRVASDRLGERVVLAGRVSDADRDGLVRLADALVFPSQYEGFGAPVVEAMALGTPVVCSDQPALAEVVADAGLVRPLTLDAWSSALDDVGERRELLVAAGRARARAFTEEVSGRALAEAYRRAMESGR